MRILNQGIQPKHTVKQLPRKFMKIFKMLNDVLIRNVSLCVVFKGKAVRCRIKLMVFWMGLFL